MARDDKKFADQKASQQAAESVHKSPESVMDGHDEDERLSGDNNVRTRESDAREYQSRESTQDMERIAAFRQAIFTSALPPIPAMEGYHICWLTTTNPRDSIANRLRLGYELLTTEMVPGFEHSTLKDGPFAGCIGVEEMVAARLPMNLYLAYMHEAHHAAPLAEEERLRAVTEVIAEQAKRDAGKAPILGDGTAELGKGPPRGKFELY